MKLDDLFLKKEELPILHGTCFQIPIHPKLLNENIKINENIAKDIFPQVAEEWSNEMQKKFPEGWECDYNLRENGFVSGFSISRNYGGSLYFLEDELNCRAFGKSYIKFSDEKRKEFTSKENQLYTYASHNIDYYPGALFLRNWAIKYMNEVFKEIF